MKKAYGSGFSKIEILVTLGLIGIVTVITIPFVLNNPKVQETREIEGNDVVDGIQKSFQSFESTSGAINRGIAPSFIVSQSINGSQAQSISRAANLPTNCRYVSVPAKRYIHQNKRWAIYVSDSWIRGAGRNDYTNICALSLDDNQTVATARIFRDGTTLARVRNQGGADADLDDVSTVTSTSVSTTNINGITAAAATSLPLPPVPPITKFQQLVWASRYKDRTLGDGNEAPRLETFLGKYFDSNFMMKGGFDNVHLFTPTDDGDPNSKMTLFQQIDYKDLLSNIRVTWKDVPQTDLDRIGWTRGTTNLTGWQARSLGKLLGYPDCNLGYGGGYEVKETLDCVMFKMPVRDTNGDLVIGQDGFPLMEGNAKQILYTGADGVTRELVAGDAASSPVKIALTPKNAIASGMNGFPFDVDGFSHDGIPPFVTSGGLEPDEAWLAYDRLGNGLFNKDRVLDGDDIFGDHRHQYRSGYEDLAETFKNDLVVDQKHQRYIPIQPLSWWEETWIWLTRLFGFNKAPNASYDLKLIKASNDVIPASQVLSRIYVDYVDVKEYDRLGNNAIFQRSMAVYTNGEAAWSGDQWFHPVSIFILKDPVTPAN